MAIARRNFTLADLAARVGGQVLGEPETVIDGVADPALAGPTDLVFLIEAKYLESVKSSRAGAVVVREPQELSIPQIQVANPRVAMAALMALFVPEPPFSGIHPTAVVDPSATIEPGAAVGPHVVVGAHSVVGAGTLLHPGVVVGRHVTIGRDCLLYPRVVIYDDVTLGDRVILHAGTVVGSDGYGFVPDASGKHLKVPQLGNVILGDDVECGANVAIDRGTFGSTVIGRGTKLDNLVHIGHNDQIGEDVLIVSQTGISGSVKVGNRVTLAGQVGVAGHLSIGDGAMVLARSGVTKDVPARSVVSGFPARLHKEELKRQAAFAGLDRLRAQLRALRQGPSMEEQPHDR